MNIEEISLDVQDEIIKEENINNFLEMLSFDIEKRCFKDCTERVNESIYKTFNKIKSGEDVENYYYSPNDGKIIYKENKYGGKFKVESKKRDDIQRLKAFYIDIDFKDKNGNHYSDDILLKKKEEMLERLKGYWKEHIIVRPNIIVESKNGFHLYYVIKQDHIIESEEVLRKRKENEKILSEALDWDFSKLDDIKNDHINRIDELTVEEWQLLEDRIYLTYRYGLEIREVDPAVRKPGQLLRLPYSVHKKTGQNSFDTRILFIAKPMSLSTIILSFKKESCESYKNDSEKNDVKNNSALDVSQELLDENHSELVNKIKNLDIEYFKENVGEVPHLAFSDRREAINYIARQDMSKILDIKCPENFCSPFRIDKKPSCSIFKKKDGIYRFYDRAQKDAIQGSILDIIQKVVNVSLTKAVDFLAEVYNLEIPSYKPEKIDINVLNEIVNYNKKLFSEYIYKYALSNKLIILYNECLECWVEGCKEKPEVPFERHRVMITIEYLFNKLQDKYMDYNPFKKAVTLKRYIMQMEALGVMKLARGGKNKQPKEFLFKKLDENELNVRCMMLKEQCKNVKNMNKTIVEYINIHWIDKLGRMIKE